MSVNIKRIRKQRGFTQSQLAERAGISFGYMNDIERSRRWPSADNIARLADALRLDPYQLFLPNEDSPYFDRHHTLTTFSRLIKNGVSEKIDQVLESLLQPYGPLRNTDRTFAAADRISSRQNGAGADNFSSSQSEAAAKKSVPGQSEAVTNKKSSPPGKAAEPK